MIVDHQHNSDKFGISWGGLDIMKGLANGSKVSDSGITGGWSWRADGNGGGVFSFDPDRSGALTFQIEAANLLHQQLFSVWNLDTGESGGQGGLRNSVADILVKNNDILMSYTFHNVRIQRPPPFALATESSIVPWVFLYTGVTYKPDLSQQNVIGVGVIPTLPAEP